MSNRGNSGIPIKCVISRVSRLIRKLLPVVFTCAYAAALFGHSRFMFGEPRNPATMTVFALACLTSAGWVIRACLVGVAFLFGVASWRTARLGPGLGVWITTMAAATSMYASLRMAILPLVPSLDAFDGIRQELLNAKSTTASNELVSVERWIVSGSDQEVMHSPAFRESMRSHWLHRDALQTGLAALAVSIGGVFWVWRGSVPDRKAWLRFHAVVVILGSVSLAMLNAFPRQTSFWETSFFLVVTYWLSGVTAVAERTDNSIAVAEPPQEPEPDIPPPK